MQSRITHVLIKVIMFVLKAIITLLMLMIHVYVSHQWIRLQL